MLLSGCVFLVACVGAGLSSYPGTVELGEGYRISWEPREAGVEFLLEAATRGYLGLGLSHDGSLPSADILMAWVDDDTGKGHIVDCYGSKGKAVPIEDPVQDYKLLEASQNSTHTIIKFSRAWDTCDRKHDVAIVNDTMQVVWTMSKTDPGKYSSWKGISWADSTGINIPTPPLTYVKEEKKHWDVLAQDLSIPDDSHTFYWCKIYKVPSLGQKHHIIGYKPIIEAGHKGLVQHMVLYECLGFMKFEQYGSHGGSPCHSSSTPRDWEACITPVVAWAQGSQGEFYPENVGLPMSEGEGKSTYFMLEIHYDNPALQRVRDNSGLRLYYTDKLREYDGGMMTTGIAVTPVHIIPPRQPQFTSNGYCDNQCTNLMFPESGIKVVSVAFHSHGAGKEMRLRHVREGKELKVIAEDNQFDPTFQQSRRMMEKTVIMPGDDVITECVYSTTNRSKLTLGGYAINQELCMSHILYYPRTALAGCSSMTPVDFFFHTFGVQEFYHHSMDEIEKILLKLTDKQIQKARKAPMQSLFFRFDEQTGFNIDAKKPPSSILQAMAALNIDDEGEDSIFSQLVINKPEEFQNKSFMAHLRDLPWMEKVFTQSVEEILYKRKHRTFCKLQDSSPAMPSGVYKFPNLTSLSGRVRESRQCKKGEGDINSYMDSTANPQAHLSLLTVSLLAVLNLLFNTL